MIYITRKVEFCASHRLVNPEVSDEENRRMYGCCNNPSGHGHNYVMEVTVRGAIDPVKHMLMDLKDLKELVYREIIDKVDHHNLNVDVDFLEGINPSTENLVVAFWEQIADKLPHNCELYELKLWETDNNMVMYRGEGAELIRQPALAAAESAR